MNSQKTTIAILATLSVSLALARIVRGESAALDKIGIAEDFKTLNGKEYKDVTVTRVEPDGIVIKTKSGISKIYFLELPQEVQQKFNYDPQTAAAYSAQQAAALAATQNQAQRQQPAAGPKRP